MAKILIIGGGVSGLSAGIYARLHGHEAIVCERHSIAGGNLTGWDRGDYHIDNCIHWLTGTNPVTSTYKMWEELDALGNVDVFQGDALYTSDIDGETLSLSRDLKKFESDMLALSPQDEKEIKSLIRAVKVIQGIEGIAGENHDEKASVGQILCSIPTIMKYYKITTGELSARFKHPLLSFFFSSFWGEDFGAFALIFVFAHFCGNNGGIPKGSSCAMAERMVKRLEKLGGELLLKKEAVKINCIEGKAESVSFADGTTIEADYVVLTGDPAVMFGNLLEAPMPKRLEKKYKNPRLKRFSSYQCAFTCDFDKLPFKGDFIFKLPKKLGELLGTKQLIVREFSHEVKFAPPGKNILQTLTFAYEESAKAFIKLKKLDKKAYQEKKKELSEAIRGAIEKRFPQLEGKLKCIDVWTPATYKRYVDTEIGSWMSFALPSKMIPIRVGNGVDGLSNVILATQWQQSPGGLPIAAEGGRLAIKTILKKEKNKSR